MSVAGHAYVNPGASRRVDGKDRPVHGATGEIGARKHRICGVVIPDTDEATIGQCHGVRFVLGVGDAGGGQLAGERTAGIGEDAASDIARLFPGDDKIAVGEGGDLRIPGAIGGVECDIGDLVAVGIGDLCLKAELSTVFFVDRDQIAVGQDCTVRIPVKLSAEFCAASQIAPLAPLITVPSSRM